MRYPTHPRTNVEPRHTVPITELVGTERIGVKTRLHALVSRHGRCEAGFTMIELMIAVFVMVGGLMALVGTFDVSRQLTRLSERKEAATHVGEREAEKVLSLSYPKIGMSTVPSHSSDPANPRFYVTDGDGTNPSTYKWSQRPGAPTPNTEPLMDAGSGQVVPGPETWTDTKSGVTGKLYRFVTWVNDTKCGPDPATLCPGSQDYKRVTIALTVDG